VHVGAGSSASRQRGRCHPAVLAAADRGTAAAPMPPWRHWPSQQCSAAVWEGLPCCLESRPAKWRGARTPMLKFLIAARSAALTFCPSPFGQNPSPRQVAVLSRRWWDCLRQPMKAGDRGGGFCCSGRSQHGHRCRWQSTRNAVCSRFLHTSFILCERIAPPRF
jgi:hypothetical protein